MNKLISLLLLAVTTVLHAATGTITFNGNNAPGSVEYFAEQKQPDNTWKEVVKGPAAPLIVTIPNNVGVYTYRVRARIPGASGGSAPSNEVSGNVEPNPPTNASMVIATASVQVSPDGKVTVLASASVPKASTQ